ncbi:MAG: WD40 repeat domain-containing protein [Phycisphaeraceae bacterium]|nr:WD40 repeat domain-containing protein [Phycisphaeraceae bacterium]
MPEILERFTGGFGCLHDGLFTKTDLVTLTREGVHLWPLDGKGEFRHLPLTWPGRSLREIMPTNQEMLRRRDQGKGPGGAIFALPAADEVWVCSGTGAVAVFHLDGGKLTLRSTLEVQGRVQAVSANGEFVLFSNDRNYGLGTIFDVIRSRSVGTIGQQGSVIVESCFSEDGQYLLALMLDFGPDSGATFELTLIRFHIRTGRIDNIQTREHQGIGAIALTPNGDRVIIGTGKYELKTKAFAADARWTSLSRSNSGITAIEVSPSGEFVVAGNEHGDLWCVSIATGEQKWRIPGIAAKERDGRTRLIRWSPDNARILVDIEGHPVRVIDVAEGRELLKLPPHSSEILFRISDDGEHVFRFSSFGAASSSLGLSRDLRRSEFDVIGPFAEGISDFAMVAGGQAVAVVTSDGGISVQQLNEGVVSRRRPIGRFDQITLITEVPSNQNRLFAAKQSGNIELIDSTSLKTLAVIARIRPDFASWRVVGSREPEEDGPVFLVNAPIQGVFPSPCGKSIVILQADGVARYQPLEGREDGIELKTPDSFISRILGVSRSGRTVVTRRATWDTVDIWQIGETVSRRSMTREASPLLCVIPGFDDRTFWMLSADGRLSAVDIATLEIIGSKKLIREEAAMASSSTGGEVIHWDFGDGRYMVQRLRWPDGDDPEQ